MRPLILAAIAGYGAAAIWVLTTACGAPEDGCASAGSTVLYVLMVGTPIALLLLGVLGVRRSRRGSRSPRPGAR